MRNSGVAPLSRKRNDRKEEDCSLFSRRHSEMHFAEEALAESQEYEGCLAPLFKVNPLVHFLINNIVHMKSAACCIEYKMTI